MLKKYGALAGALVVLGGCAPQSPEVPPPPPPPAVKHLVAQIKTAGIHVIQQGDRLTMIIPTDLYFEPGTTTVKEDRQEALREMALFTKTFADTYPRSVIRVTGYTDRVFSHRTQLELSQSYASAVSAYIFNAGVDSNRIATQGRGSSEPIAGEFGPSSAALNRRVMVQVN